MKEIDAGDLKHGLLLINLGTPERCTVSGIRQFLGEFLADKRVINLPAFFRYLLLYTIILPFRSKKTTKAYQLIWRKEGSPLLFYSQQLQKKLQNKLGNTWNVVLGMRYGEPSLQAALLALKDCKSITVLPLYPQHSSSATGSAIQEVFALLGKRPNFPFLDFIRDFHNTPSFIEAQAHLIEPYLESHDFILFSYHSIPENHLSQAACKSPCPVDCPPYHKNSQLHFDCYRAQCYSTSEHLAKRLNLAPSYYATSFQSRLGKTPWIKPYTDQILSELIEKGVRRLLVACPSFVTDCLETLEEINIRAQKQWQELGGKTLTQVPCVNDHPIWIEGLGDWIKLRADSLQLS